MIQRLLSDLPVFGVLSRAGTAVYAPGRLAWFGDSKPTQGAIPQSILEAAVATVQDWAALARAPFMPVCLTLNLTNRCLLNCSYCFAKFLPDRNRRQEQPDSSAILAAARLVIESCQTRKKPFQIVFSGGGEPTLAWDSLQAVVRKTRALAESRGIEWKSYIATNGCTSATRLRWLARNISKIGLSCDGPPDIHDLQRPTADLRPSAGDIKRAADILRKGGSEFAVRATITPASALRQAEIVRWLCERLGARQIRFEPVYHAAPGMEFRPEDASRFVCEFLAAQQVARELGADLSLSGVRLDELHGPHCNVLKDVLHLRPDGTATACFLSCTGASLGAAIYTIGCLDNKTGQYRLDSRRIAQLRGMAARLPSRCKECLNAYHCARSCPDLCLLSEPLQPDDSEPDFRCRVARQLTTAWLLDAGARCRSKAPDPSSERIKQFLAGVEAQVHVARVVSDWISLGPDAPTARSLPAPLWIRRGFQMDREEAWRRISGYLRNTRTDGPLSVYVHVPFCRLRCGFCDCYAEPVAKGSNRSIGAFAKGLLAEIDAWGSCQPPLPASITTVHFGGGTPNSLPADVFGAIVTRIRDSLGVTPATEWALESTTSLLTGEGLQWLRELGFTRLHVGIQTLEEEVRSAIGRRENSEKAVARLRLALELGFVVSVDLIYGLPGQSTKGWLATLDKLVDLGIDGFSLYSLQRTERNQRFLSRLAAPPLASEARFALFHAAHQFLLRHGYHKNHFAHFAKERDRNLYYQHAVRRENLLALGPSADGVFGPFLYRHPQLAAYSLGAADGGPVLEGALQMSPIECRLRGAEAELMGNAISWRTFENLGLDSLLSEWQSMGLISLTSGRPEPELSATGSWEIAGMLQALTDRLPQTDSRPRNVQRLDSLDGSFRFSYNACGKWRT